MTDTCGGNTTATSFDVVAVCERSDGEAATARNTPNTNQNIGSDVPVKRASERDFIPADAPAPSPFRMDSSSDSESGNTNISFLKQRLGIPRSQPFSNHGTFRDAIDPRSVLTKTMVEPPQIYNNGYAKEYAPDGAMAKVGITPTRYSMPASWPDPYVISACCMDNDDANETGAWVTSEFNPGISIVDVTRSSEYVMPAVYSELGRELNEKAKAPIYDRSQQSLAMWTAPRYNDMGSEMYLMSQFVKAGEPMSQDCAPLLRCGLLAMSFLSGNELLRMTSVGQEAGFTDPPMSTCEVRPGDGDPADDGSEGGEPIISVKDGTCNVHFITMKSYVDVFSNTEASDLEDTTVTAGMLRSAVVVPVTLNQLGSDTLIPYVISFTTTLWWNGFVSLRLMRPEKTVPDYQNEIRYDGWSRANLTVVDGEYKHIVCVVVDSGNHLPRTVGFGDWRRTPTDPYCKSASKEIYKWLGFLPPEHKTPPDSDALMRTYHQICETVGTGDMMNRVNFMLSELCFDLPMGYTVRTTSTDNTKQIFGPKIMTPKVNIKIGKYQVPKISSKEDLKHHINGLSAWRASPLGLFRSAQAAITNVKKDFADVTSTRFDKLTNTSTDYCVTENSSTVRLLVAVNAFANAYMCDNGAVAEFGMWAANLQYTASFIAMCSSWWFLESGLPLVDFNLVTEDKWTQSLPEYRSVYSATTLGFITRISPRKSYPQSDTWQKRVKLYTGLDTWQAKISSLRTTHMPFWAVKGFMEKLGYKTPADWEPYTTTDYMTGDGWKDISGYQVMTVPAQPGRDYWYKLPYLTSTLNYDVGDNEQQIWFDIRMPDAKRMFSEPTLTCWFPHTRIDESKSISGRTGPWWTDGREGCVELQAMVNPYHRISRKMKVCDSVVSYKCRTGNSTNSSSSSFEVVINQPDPLVDWLLTGLLKIAPHVVVGDAPGAVFAAGMHVAESIRDWIKDRFRITERPPMSFR